MKHVIGSVLALALLAGVQPAGKPNFSGDWKLNLEKSNFGAVPPPTSITRKIVHAEPSLTIDEVQSRLPQLIDGLHPGEEVVITRGDKPVARLIPPAPEKPTPVFGSCAGMLTILAEDDDHLDHFAEYMP